MLLLQKIGRSFNGTENRALFWARHTKIMELVNLATKFVAQVA